MADDGEVAVYVWRDATMGLMYWGDLVIREESDCLSAEVWI